MAQTFQQLQKQIEALKAKAEQIRRAELGEVVAKIKVAIEAYGISKQDLFGTGPAGVAKKQARGPRPAGSPKYSDGKGNTWVGMGKRPRWLQDALAAGAKLEDFLSQAHPPATESAAEATTTAAKKPAKKKSQGKGGKAKYRDDAGNAWSGRGPRPRWLKDAMAGGKSLDDLRA
jgi:DNA-binding protein H-NS